MRPRRLFSSCRPSVLALLVLIPSAPHAVMQEPRRTTIHTAAAPAADLLVLSAPEIPAAGSAATPLPPGHYIAFPYTLRVYVPPFIDTKMAVEPGEHAVKPLTIRPELRLVPVR